MAEEEDVCRICHLPGEPEAERPLRHPCACRGSIRFVHDDCLLRWLATRPSPSCEVCNRAISVAPVYAAGAPARLPLSEFALALACKLLAWLALLLALLLSVCLWELVMPLTTAWVWRLALSRTWAQVRRLLSLRRRDLFASLAFSFRFMPSPDTVLACVSIRRAFLRELHHLHGPARVAARAVAPFALWVARLEAHLQRRLGGFDSLQLLALHTVEASLMVVIADVAFAFVFGFLPFSLGRIVLCCVSCFSFGNVDIDRSDTSTVSILLTGYGSIFSLAVLFAALHTSQQYSRGERLTVTVCFKAFIDWVYWLSTPFRVLPGIHVMVATTFTFSHQLFRWIISLANVSLNITAMVVMCPLLFGWLLDICTSKLFGATLSQKLKHLVVSSFASNALHWFIGCIYLMLRALLSSLLTPVLFRLGGRIPFHITWGQTKIRYFGDPFYKFYLMMLPGLFVGVFYVAIFFLVPVEFAYHLVPTVFPLDIIFFNPPTQGMPFWQAPRTYAELLCCVLLLRFLVCSTLKYLQPGAFAEKLLRYWFTTVRQALGLSDSDLLIAYPDRAGQSETGNSLTRKDHHDRPTEAKDKRRSVAVRMVLLLVLAWLTVVIFSSAILVAPVTVGRSLLFAMPQLPIAGALKANDLFAFVVGFCIISTIVAASRDSFAYMTSGRTHLLTTIICNWGIIALKSSPLLFIWIGFIPFLIGSLVDCLLIAPFVVPGNETPVLDFFCTWFTGMQLLKFWTKLVRWTRVAPFLAYFVDERWDWKLNQAKEDGFSGLRSMWVLQEVLMPITVKLLYALCAPYVLAKGLFPVFGYSDAVNYAVHRFAWLGSLALYVLYHLAKVFCEFLVKLHDSIRDERYLIGQRLQNYAGNS
ncbi:hypothetical protein ACP70R_003659 [Stipagrostis hirtigluma subsp. patula]